MAADAWAGGGRRGGEGGRCFALLRGLRWREDEARRWELSSPPSGPPPPPPALDCADAGTLLLVSLPLAPTARGRDSRMVTVVHERAPERETRRGSELGQHAKEIACPSVVVRRPSSPRWSTKPFLLTPLNCRLFCPPDSFWMRGRGSHQLRGRAQKTERAREPERGRSRFRAIGKRME